MVALNHGTPRFLPDKEKPPRLGARGLFLEGRALVPRDLEIVQDRRTRIEGNPGRPGSSRIVAGAVPAALRRRHDVAGLIGEVLLAFDLDADLAFHDEPKFGPTDMEVTL